MSWDDGTRAGRPGGEEWEDRPDDTVLRPARPATPPAEDPEADLTQVRPGPPSRDQVGQWSGQHYSRQRLTEESLWERSPAPSGSTPQQPRPSSRGNERPGPRPSGTRPASGRTGHHRVAGREGPPPGSPPPKLAPKPTRGLQLVALVALAGIAIAAAWLLNPRGTEPDTGRVAPRRAVAQFAKPVEGAKLSANPRGLRRDTSRDEARLPYGTIDRAHYRPAGGQPGPGDLFAVTMNSPVASLTDLEAHSGLGNRNRFGPVSCGRADQRVECTTLLKGGLLVVIAADERADMGQVAAATVDIYNALPG